MRPQPHDVEDEFKRYSTGAFLIEISDAILYSDRDYITRKDMINILRAVFGFSDARTHRAKIEMLEAKRYLRRVNRDAYRLTDTARRDIRKMKGVPETPADPGADALDSSRDEDVHISDSYTHAEPVVVDDDIDYLHQLQRGGRA
mgnify:FL=1